MKKLLSLLLAMIMMTLLFGCDNGGLDDLAVTTEGESGESELSRGSLDGDVYKNQYLGFNFTKPESWVYSTDEEIAALMNLAVDEFLDDKYEVVLENNLAIYDMMVVDTLTGSNVLVGYENLAKTLSTNITVEQYIQSVKNQLASVFGVTVTFPEEYETVKLGKTEFTRLVCAYTAQGATAQQVYYLHKADGYMSFLIVTIRSGYTVEQIEAMFQ